MPSSSLRPLLHLLQTSRGRSPAILLGAGAAVSSGGRTAEAIANHLAAVLLEQVACSPHEAFRQCSSRDLTFESALDIVGGQDSRADSLRAVLGHLEPSRGYDSLATLFQRHVFAPVCLTTNYDAILETALAKYGVAFETVVVPGPGLDDIVSVSTFPRAADDPVLLVKLHGDLMKPETLRCTERETEYLPASAAQLITEVVKHHGLLVVGHRFKDKGVLSAVLACSSHHGIYITRIGPATASDVGGSPHASLSHASTIEIDGFDQCFSNISDAFAAWDFRADHSDQLQRLWDAVWSARLNRRARRDLAKIVRIEEEMLRASDMSEVEALRHVIDGEMKGGLTVHRLELAIAALVRAIEGYTAFGSDVESVQELQVRCLELRVLRLLREEDPKRRLKCAEDLQKQALELLACGSPAPSKTNFRLLLLLGEVLKEAEYYAADYRLPSGMRLDFAEKYLDQAEQIAKQLIAKKLADDEALGAVWRHRAIVHELKGDSATDVPDKRQHYEEWLKLSVAAARRLKRDERTRAYALINEAAARVAKSRRERDVAEARKAVVVAASGCTLLHELEDARGEGWGHVHACDALLAIADLEPDRTRERSRALQEAMEKGHRAVSVLASAGDGFACYWAQLELARVYHATIPEVEEGRDYLDRALALAQSAAENLERLEQHFSAAVAYTELASLYLLRSSADGSDETSDLLHALSAAGLRLVNAKTHLFDKDAVRQAVRTLLNI